MGKSVIKILDVVHCKANPEARAKIKKCLAYDKEIILKGRAKWGKGSGRKIQTQHLITGRKGTSGLLLTGLLSRVIKFCRKEKIELEIQGKPERLKPTHRTATVKGISFREDQKKGLRKIAIKPRGKIIFPTGTGKTFIMMGICSMFQKHRILILVNSKDLLTQTVEDFKSHKFKNILVHGAGYKVDIEELLKKDIIILISTVQSYIKIHGKRFFSFWDMTIVDEGHHVNSLKSQYGQIMLTNLSPRRYALTATEPTKTQEILVNEGIFGPIIANLSYEEAIDKKIIATPKVRLLSIPYNPKINVKCRTYAQFYKYGITENKTRHLLMIKEILKRKNELSLIIIEKQNHGKIIQKMFKEKGLDIPFVYGHTNTDDRKEILEKFKNKEIKIVICSRVWKEGINIKPLNNIFYARGIKEKKDVIQAMGRGLRIDKGKDTVMLYDFLDPYKYLAEHTVHRIQIYLEKGWL